MKSLLIILGIMIPFFTYSQEFDLDTIYEHYQVINLYEDDGINLVLSSNLTPYVNDIYIVKYDDELNHVGAERVVVDSTETAIVIGGQYTKDGLFLAVDKLYDVDRFSLNLINIVDGAIKNDHIILPENISYKAQFHYEEQEDLLFLTGNVGDRENVFNFKYGVVGRLDMNNAILNSNVYRFGQRPGGLFQHPENPDHVVVTFGNKDIIIEKNTLDSIKKDFRADIDFYFGTRRNEGDYFTNIGKEAWSLETFRWDESLPEDFDYFNNFLYKWKDSLVVDKVIDLSTTGMGAMDKAFDYHDGVFYIHITAMLGKTPFMSHRILAVSEEGEILWTRDYSVNDIYKYFPQGIKRLSSGNLLIYGRKHRTDEEGKTLTEPFLFVFDEMGEILSTSDPKAELVQFQLYPNPVSDILNVKVEKEQNLKGKIFNMKGQLIRDNISITGGETYIDVHDLSKGNYYLYISDEIKYVCGGSFIKL